jgi:hypothetical protein
MVAGGPDQSAIFTVHTSCSVGLTSTPVTGLHRLQHRQCEDNDSVGLRKPFVKLN